MNQTEINLNNSTQPKLVYRVNTGPTSLPLDVTQELSQYPRVFISRENDTFALTCCAESYRYEYRIFVETKEGDKKILFTTSSHLKCCNCCEQCLIGDLCCAYACCDSIVFQMDYRRNGAPFYTQGYNITKGCHCCDIFLCCNYLPCCSCINRRLYLRENIDPDSPDIKIGRPNGKTKTNCCCACDQFAEYYNENKIKGHTVRAACCDIWKNICMNYCLTGGCLCFGCFCFLCKYPCDLGFDFEMSIEDQNGLKTGNIMIYAGCCSQKVEGKMCFCPRSYMEVNMPPNATSEQKFQIIADAIHLDLENHFL